MKNEKDDHLQETTLTPLFVEGLQKVKVWLQKEDASFLRSIFDQVGFI